MTSQLKGDGERILQCALDGSSGFDYQDLERLAGIGEELLRMGRVREASRLGQILDDAASPSLVGLILHVRAELEGGNEELLALLPKRLAEIDPNPDDKTTAVLIYLAWANGEDISASDALRFVETRQSSSNVDPEELEFLRLARAYLSLSMGNLSIFAAAFGWSRVWAMAVTLLKAFVLRSPYGTALR